MMIYLPSRKVLQRKKLAEYQKWKKNIPADHKTESFYGITIHFIDKRWILRSITLDFSPSGAKHSGKDLANIFFQVLKDYEIEGKIQGITVDNVSSNKTFIAYLSTLLNSEGIKFSFTIPEKGQNTERDKNDDKEVDSRWFLLIKK